MRLGDDLTRISKNEEAGNFILSSRGSPHPLTSTSEELSQPLPPTPSVPPPLLIR